MKKLKKEETLYEITDFKFYLQQEKRAAENTVLSYISDLRQYAVFLLTYENVRTVEDITTEHIKRYIVSLKRKDVSKQTIARKITAIKEFHKFLHREKITDDDVALFIDKPKLDKHLPTVLTEDEIGKMIDSIPSETPLGKRNKALLETLYATGLRVSELLNLRTTNVHLNSKYLEVVGKGNKERIIPLGEMAVVAIRDYIENGRSMLSKVPGDLLFYNYKGNALSRQWFFKYIQTLAKENDILKDITPHTIRHSFATHLLQNGTDLRMVQELLGHEDIATTQIYTHIEKSHLKEMYKHTHPMAREEKKDEKI